MLDRLEPIVPAEDKKRTHLPTISTASMTLAFHGGALHSRLTTIALVRKAAISLSFTPLCRSHIFVNLSGIRNTRIVLCDSRKA